MNHPEHPRYSMLIQWNGEDFTVTFPGFPGYTAQGSSWQDAARNGDALLTQIIESGEQPVARDTRFEQIEQIHKEIEEELRQSEDIGKHLRGL